MKHKLTLILLVILTFKTYSQTYSGIVSDSLINELLISEIDNRPKSSDDQKLWKKRIAANPISWNQAMIKLISSPPYNFEFQKTELIIRDRRYNRELKKITELFTQSDFEYMERQFNSEQKSKWNFKAKKGRIKNFPKRNFYSYSIPLFDKEHKKAIIYGEFGGCGGVCGGASMFVYLKKGNTWELYKTIPLWES